MLIWVGGILRYAIDVPFFTDIDVANFGLAAGDFDILAHQPHPPGYLGYVLYLKLVALLAGPDPLEIAKWGCRIAGTASIPLAYWACRQITQRVDGRALWAAGLVTVHPVLWYYGGDGQSHSAELFALLGLFGLAVRWRRDLTVRRLIGFALLAGLAGSLRPTVLVSALPIALWVIWGQPLRRWVIGAGAGLAGILAWWLPTILSTGGLDSYSRANDALVGTLLGNYSLFSDTSSTWGIHYNLAYAGWAALLIGLPAVAIGWRRAGWLVPLGGAIAVSLGFYAVVFLAELGYVAGLCGLACLLPATWPQRQRWHHHGRASVVAVVFFAWFAFGPAHLPVPWVSWSMNTSMAYMRSVQQYQEAFHGAVCADDAPATLVLTDHHDSTLLRSASYACPGLVGAMHLHNFVLRWDIDAWLFYTEDSVLPVPTEIPLENGPPVTVRLPWRFQRVLVAPGASDDFAAAVDAAATCPARRRYSHPDDDIGVAEYPAGCLPGFTIGSHTIEVKGPE